MEPVYSILCATALFLGLGLAAGLTDRGNFRPGWLLLAALLILVSDAALTRGYGLIPDFLGGEWNWTGKVLALTFTLAVAALPVFGWKRIGFTLTQNREGQPTTWLVAALLAAAFTVPALLFPSDPASAEDILFQSTMPGFEEEPFYRGLLLLVLANAFRGRWRFVGIEWHWGSLLSCVAFGLAHAAGWGDAGFEFDPVTFAVTGVPALLLIWLRERTGSLLLPIVLHNYANAIGYLV